MAAAALPEVFVAGVAETPLGEVEGHTELSMIALAAREALAEAGMTLADVDGIGTSFMGPNGAVLAGEYLGLTDLRFSGASDLGGAAFGSLVHHALLGLATGRCEVVLVVYASRQRSRRSRTLGKSQAANPLMDELETPFGLPSPVGRYALAAARHMHEFGTTEAQLAEVAVAARAWANRNPKAWAHGEPLTVEDVLSSRPISTPLKRADCCLVTDGGGALVLTTAARARDAAKPAIHVLGAGESHTHVHVASMPSLTSTCGRVSAREAFAMAGITPADVDVLEPYDSFTITVLLALEDLGFCGPGESGPFVEGGRLAPGGGLPAMTQGGGLSYCHPGAFGLLEIVEAVRQLRGEAGERQVPGDPEIAVAHAVGWSLSAASTVVLAR